MNKAQFRFIIIVVLLNSIGLSQPIPNYPTSNDPQEFTQQAEEFFVQAMKHGSGIHKEYQPAQGPGIKDDKRDWETVLARIHGDPKKYGFEASQVALGVASIRGTAKNSEIVEATRRYWEAQIRRADELYEYYAAQGTPKHPGITGHLQATIPQILRYGVPEHLSLVLDYFNSSADERNGLIFEKGPAIHISKALLEYGDERHVIGAKKFSKRLREIGRADVADDIDRSVEKIEKGAARKASENGGRSSSGSNPAKAEAEEHSAEKEDKASWIVGTIVAGVVLLGALIMVRRKS